MSLGKEMDIWMIARAAKRIRYSLLNLEPLAGARVIDDETYATKMLLHALDFEGFGAQIRRTSTAP